MNQEAEEFLDERIELAIHKAKQAHDAGDTEMAAYYEQAANTMTAMLIEASYGL